MFIVESLTAHYRKLQQQQMTDDAELAKSAMEKEFKSQGVRLELQ